MADTGAPWNIPYVAGSDLVADWPTDNQTQAEAIADALDLANLGIGTNVVQTLKTDIFAANSATYTPVTGLSVTITPSSDTSKILIIGSIQFSADSQRSVHVRIAGGNSSAYIGDAGGSRVQSVISARDVSSAYELNEAMLNVTMLYLDSPATTSSVTYDVEIRRDSAASGNVTVNRSGATTDNDRYGRGASTLLAIEVSA